MYSENINTINRDLERQDNTETENKLAKKVIIELGPGMIPLPGSMHPDVVDYYCAQHKKEHPIILGQNEIYIGIEPSCDAIQESKVSIDSVSEYIRGKVQLIQGYGERLPIKSNSVERVFIRNLFTDPSFLYYNRASVDNKRLYVKEKIAPIIKELKRVVKKDGIVIIAETYTAEICEPEYIIEFFIENGFILSKHIKARQSDDNDFAKALKDIAKVDPNIISNKEGNYILEFARAD